MMLPPIANSAKPRGPSQRSHLAWRAAAFQSTELLPEFFAGFVVFTGVGDENADGLVGHAGAVAVWGKSSASF
jgi:hypothetical protein